MIRVISWFFGKCTEGICSLMKKLLALAAVVAGIAGVLIGRRPQGTTEPEQADQQPGERAI